jgi:predicted transcriptional regulator
LKIGRRGESAKIKIDFLPILLLRQSASHLEDRKNMEDVTPEQQTDYVVLAAEIVSAYVSNNSIPASELGNLLASVYAGISGLASGGTAKSAQDEVEKPTPAQIKKSITPDALISFEDGKPYKTLRRHLTIRGLTPEAYRAKHGLPVDYPMTSASYSAQRSELARSLGLGNHRKDASATASDEAQPDASEEAKPARRVGRPRKADAAA